MAKKKNICYVVWKGHQTGLFDSWTECQKQISGFPGAEYKGFSSYEEAQVALERSYLDYKQTKKSSTTNDSAITLQHSNQVVYDLEALSVDAACSGNPGLMEYRGVWVGSGKEVFKVGPFKKSTNNIGEFLALVHGLAYLKQENKESIILYSDSRIAMGWVKKKKCNTKLVCTNVNARSFELIRRAEKWLQTHTYKTKIVKWETKEWGEIPADFGRK